MSRSFYQNNNVLKKTGDTMTGDLGMAAGKTVDGKDISAVNAWNFSNTAVATNLSISDVEQLVDCSAVCGARRALIFLAAKCTDSNNRSIDIFCPDINYNNIDHDNVCKTVLYVAAQNTWNFLIVPTDSSGRFKVRRHDGYTQTWTINVVGYVKTE